MEKTEPKTGDARAAILAAIRRQPPPSQPLPDLEHNWVRYADPVTQFADVLRSVGGRCLMVGNAAQIQTALDELPEYTSARQICSLVPGVGRPNVDLESIDDPHRLEAVDFAILPGEFAVAENGAVWINDVGLKHRAVYFIAQHLALVVPAHAMVHNLHEAYERLSFSEPGFGVFISGPSKTADIEQSLVIGAHGPRSLTVFLLSTQ